jgi:hypothetical protein
MYLSTLRAYIEALGGELEVSARFDNCFVRLNQFAEIEVHAVEPTSTADRNATPSDEGVLSEREQVKRRTVGSD